VHGADDAGAGRKLGVEVFDLEQSGHFRKYPESGVRCEVAAEDAEIKAPSSNAASMSADL